MRKELRLFYHRTPGRGRLRIGGAPVVLPLFMLGLTWLALVLLTSLILDRDRYYPFEGRVLKITTPWSDHFIFEFTSWEHLVIQTTNGEVIDRLIDLSNRLASRVAVSDYVIKGRGFRNYPRARGKKTGAELMAEWGRLAKPDRQKRRED